MKSRNGVLGQNGPFLKLNVQNGHILKLLFKMASLIFALKPHLANAALVNFYLILKFN